VSEETDPPTGQPHEDPTTDPLAARSTGPSKPTTPAAATGTAPGRPARRALVVAAVIATIVIVVIVAAAIAFAAGRKPSRHPASDTATGLGAPAETNYPTAPAVEVQRIHATLHDMGARCTSGAGPDAQRQIGLDVDQLIAFAKSYPDAQFIIDDEHGTALDVLLIARDEMKTCDPAAAERANQALPAQFRATPRPTPIVGTRTGP
jgi:hypothetical protein